MLFIPDDKLMLDKAEQFANEELPISVSPCPNITSVKLIQSRNIFDGISLQLSPIFTALRAVQPVNTSEYVLLQYREL